VLVFIGLKMLLEKWVHVPTPVSLAAVAGILTLSVVASLARKRDAAD
jgi:tellurite resistance protein TerC